VHFKRKLLSSIKTKICFVVFFYDFVDRLRQGGHLHELSSINNEIAFCEHKTGVFHFNVLQLLNKLSLIKICPSALRHPVRSSHYRRLRWPDVSAELM
jgi:hypothetical protein